MKRFLSIIVIFMVAALVAPLFAQDPGSTTTVIPVEWEYSQGCAAYFEGRVDIPFTDTAGSNWNHLTIRIPMSTNSRPIGTDPVPTVTVFINGVQIGQPVTVYNRSIGCWENSRIYEFEADSVPGYYPYGTNTFSMTATGWYVGGPPAELEFITPLRTFAFTLLPTATDKLLTRKSRTDDNYPSLAQVSTAVTDRPRYRFRGAVSSSVGASVETDVWLRVVDPPDPAPYVPASMRGPNDNRDPSPKGVLLTNGCADPSCRAATGTPLKVHAAPGGVVGFELEATDRYAGDNYQIEASFDPDFTCATAGANGTNLCARSGIVTAWKRIYVEKMRMLRNGLFLAQKAAAGATSIVVRGNHYGGNTGNDRLRRNDRIVLVHAPQLDGSDDAAGWYMEVHSILDVAAGANPGEFLVQLGTRNGHTVTPESLANAYGPDTSRNSVGDGISRIPGAALTANDIFDASNDLVTTAVFPAALTEYVYLSGLPNSQVPVPFLASAEEPRLQALADKWSSVTGWNGASGIPAANHQLLLITDSDGRDPRLASGLTISRVSGETSSFVFRATIDDLAGHSHPADAERWAMKTCAHELAHQWLANDWLWVEHGSGERDHCPTTAKAYDDPSIYCLLASFDSNGTATQRANGIARFHMLPDPNNSNIFHSEYFEIRRHNDPFQP